ncbi:MAG: YifB family Mg chelatase-like AAA ATPase [Clostridia bacterium]|nr:YifB family Mg chelatase-like AAA ATPase [Clostridia bacterium]
MVVKVNTATLLGIEGKIVIAEADFSGGLPSFDIVGLPDAAVKEAKERVKAAIRNSEFEFPAKKAVINLAPADLKKEGSQFDLPIAVACLAGTGQIKGSFDDYVFLGELGLSGDIRGVSGILPSVIGARDAGFAKFIVPYENREEAALVENVEIYGAKSLSEVYCHITGEKVIDKTETQLIHEEELLYDFDFYEVKGQEKLRRGVEIAVAGGHNVLMVGSPGSGKSMIAKRIPTIMPPMTFDEVLEVTKIHSVAGVLQSGKAVTKRPFRAPHHSASGVSIVGGGAKAKPGEISLAHKGVLFLDELPEYKKDVIEAMRQPIEDGAVTVARATGTYTYPANVMLVCAMNPCRCGYYGDKNKKCRCSESDVAKYLNKVSGPMLDRIDIQLEAKSVNYDDLQKPKGESSAALRERIEKARAIQQERYKNESVTCNADLSGYLVEKYCVLGEDEKALLENAFKTMTLSARAYTRILKVARTIADLDGRENIDTMDIAEAIGYRSLDKKLWK